MRVRRPPLIKLAARAARPRTSPFASDDYDVALIPCSEKKFKEGLTPLTLYSGPLWAGMLYHAQQRAAAVIIMSAKYGLLRLSDPVRYYDTYISDLTPDQRKALVYRIQNKPMVELLLPAKVRPDDQPRILSYLPAAYWEVFAEALPGLAEKVRRPYKSLPMMTMAACLSKEIENYGKNPGRR